jgi:hypothetical protein
VGMDVGGYALELTLIPIHPTTHPPNRDPDSCVLGHLLAKAVLRKCMCKTSRVWGWVWGWSEVSTITTIQQPIHTLTPSPTHLFELVLDWITTFMMCFGLWCIWLWCFIFVFCFSVNVVTSVNWYCSRLKMIE